MIFLNLKIDNIYMFKDTFIDFTYPKKISDSTIEGEFLTDFPNIKYKKVCILMGANASGKTTLGRIMCSINNYLSGHSLLKYTHAIHDKNKNASFEVTYITPDTGTIHSLKVEFSQKSLISESYKCNNLKISKSLKKTLTDLANSKTDFKFDHKTNKHGIEPSQLTSVAFLTGTQMDSKNSSWNYSFTSAETATKNYMPSNIDILEAILKAFDTSILNVLPIKSANHAYTIQFKNSDAVIVDNGKIADEQRLSRGTLESIEVARFICTIIETNQKETSRTYFLDEKIAYSHSEIEVAMLNLMIAKLNNQSQLFYTTHNYDILEMNLPSHSYIFMKKEDFIEVSQPEKMGYTKNDRSLLGYVKNDVFNTIPDTSKIDDLL